MIPGWRKLELNKKQKQQTLHRIEMHFSKYPRKAAATQPKGAGTWQRAWECQRDRPFLTLRSAIYVLWKDKNPDWNSF